LVSCFQSCRSWPAMALVRDMPVTTNMKSTASALTDGAGLCVAAFFQFTGGIGAPGHLGKWKRGSSVCFSASHKFGKFGGEPGGIGVASRLRKFDIVGEIVWLCCES
jgi:hypothetical protein